MKNENIKHIWTLASKGSSIDQETNLLSIFEIAEEFTVDVKIDKDKDSVVLNLPIQFQLITLWEKINKGNEEKAEIQLEYFDPNNKKLGGFNYKLVIPADKKRFRNKINVNGLGISTPGRYLFKINKKEDGQDNYKLAGEMSIDMVINKTINK